MIDYEIYYNELVGELKRACLLLEQYRNQEPLTGNSNEKSYIYRAYLNNSIPQNITTLIDIFRNSEILDEQDEKAHLDLEEIAGQHYVQHLYEKVNTNKTIVINVFKKFVSLSDESLLINNLFEIKQHLTRSEKDLERLDIFLRR